MKSFSGELMEWPSFLDAYEAAIDNSSDLSDARKFTYLRSYLTDVALKTISGLTFDYWRRGVVVITTAQLHSTKAELRFYAGSSLARGVSEICDVEHLWQWSRLEIRLNAFCRSTIPQKQFIIIIIIIIIIINENYRKALTILNNCTTS